MRAPTPFIVRGTRDEDRSRSPSDFAVVIGSRMATTLGVESAPAVFVEVLRPGPVGNPRIGATLLTDPRLDDEKLATIRMDQTLRTALGIVHTDADIKASDLPLRLSRLDLSPRQRRHAWLLDRVFGVRHVLARVEKPHPNDIEKDICRLSKDTLAMLGTDEGRRVVVSACRPDAQGVLERRECSIRALDLSKDLRDARDEEKTLQRRKGWQARYIHPGKLLGVSPDITTIWLDQHERHALGVRPGDAVSVRRDLSDLFKSQAFEFSVVTGLAAPFAKFFPSRWAQCHPNGALLVSFLPSAAIALGIVCVRLRARVR